MALLPLFSSIFFLIGLTLSLAVPEPGEPEAPRWLLYPLLGYPGIGLAGVVGGLLLYRAGGFLFAIVSAVAPLGVVVFGLVAMAHWWLG